MAASKYLRSKYVENLLKIASDFRRFPAYFEPAYFESGGKPKYASKYELNTR
jgi:hypothetical protein